MKSTVNLEISKNLIFLKKLIPTSICSENYKNNLTQRMPPRLLYEDIVKTFESKGCKLVSSNYLSNKKPLEYLCSCGSKTVHKVKLYSCEKGTRCKDCREIRLKQTNQERYGHDYVSQRPEMKESTLKGIRKYIAEKKYTLEELQEIYKQAGCELLATEYKDIKSLMKFKCLCGKEGNITYNKFSIGQRCSDNTCMDIRKKKTNVEKFGAISYTGTEEYNERRAATCIERYGTEFAAQSVEVQNKIEKSGYTYKIYTFPSGRQENVQGYEPFGINHLLKTYNETELIFGRANQPEIWYYRDDDKLHRYFSDIYIPKANLIVEIKSTWTYKKGLEEGKLQQQEAVCKGLGYNYLCLVFGEDETLQEYTTHTTQQTPSLACQATKVAQIQVQPLNTLPDT